MQRKNSGKNGNAPKAPPMTEDEKAYLQDLNMQQQFHELRGEIFKAVIGAHSKQPEGCRPEVAFSIANAAARVEFKARVTEAKEMLAIHKRPMRVPTLYKMLFGEDL